MVDLMFFLAIFVLIPILTGMALRRVLRQERQVEHWVTDEHIRKMHRHAR